MIATSDSTALAAIRSDARIGRSTEANRGMAIAPRRVNGPTARRSTMKNNTGIAIDPIRPSGSRAKILISSQVSRQSPRNIGKSSVSNCVAGQLEKNVLERWDFRAEIGDPEAMFRQAV